MNTHKNARLTPRGRLAIVHRAMGGVPVAEVARGACVSPRTVWKWLARFRAEGEAGLQDRTSRPRRLARQLPRHRRRQILRARRKRRLSSLAIAQRYRLPVSTVVTLLRRHGLNRLARLEPERPIQRYERARAGDLVHLDIKKLARITRVGHRIHGDRRNRARGAGWEYVHVAIDDSTRVSYAEVLANEQGASAAGFLERAASWFRARGIACIRQVMTDNGPCYLSADFKHAIRAVGAEHIRTRPYTPQTNGKAERLIRTLLQEWAYAQAYRSSHWRTSALERYLNYYNGERRHSALGMQPPFARLAERL